MASSSTSLENGRFVPLPRLDYDPCRRTLLYCKTVKPEKAQGTPLDRCHRLIWNGHLDVATLPLHSITPSSLPPLTNECKKTLKERITIPIRVGTSTVKPIDWLSNLLVFLREEPGCTFRDIFVNGSGLPLTRDYWEAYLKLFDNLEPKLHEDFCSILTASNSSCSNIDTVLCVTFSNLHDSEKRKDFETRVMLALQSSLDPHLTTKQIYHQAMACPDPTIKGPTQISDLCTVFTIGKEVTFDLTVWYHWPHLPELYSQQGQFLSLSHLVTNKYLLDHKVKTWPSMHLKLEGVTPSQLLIDRCINIVRFNPASSVGVPRNIGLLKKYFIMKTKGSLGVQKGLLEWTFMIYLQTRDNPKKIASDVQNSYTEHLPQELTTLLVHRMHWMASFHEISDSLKSKKKQAEKDEIKEIDRTLHLLLNAQKELGRNLKFPSQTDQPKFLQMLFTFLKKFPQNFPMLLSVIEFIMVLEYLKNHEKTVTCGLWEGELHLRFCPENSPSYFQRPLKPSQTLEKMLSFLSRKSLAAAEAKEAAKSLLFTLIDYFELEEGFLYHTKSLRILMENGFKDDLLQNIWTIYRDVREPSSPDLHEMDSFSHIILKQNNLSVNSPTIPELIKKENWHALAQKLLKIGRRGVPQEKMSKFGEFVWLLFSKWAKEPSVKDRQRIIRELIPLFIKPLELTGNDERRAVFFDLLRNYFGKTHLLNFLQNHEKNSWNLLSKKDLDELAIEKIKQCYDPSLLIQYDKFSPELVRRHVIESLHAPRLPPQRELSGLIAFLHEQDPERWDAMQHTLARQLTLEHRFKELETNNFAIHFLDLFSNLYAEALSNSDFSTAYLILTQMRIKAGLPFDNEEFMILEKEALARPTSLTFQRTSDLWQRSLGRNETLAEQALTLCLHLITTPLKIDRKVISQFWNFVVEKDKIIRLKSLTEIQWKSLFENMRKSRNHYELLQALTCLFHIKTKLWNADIENNVQEVLKWNLSSGKQKQYSVLKAGSLLYLLFTMSEIDQIDWTRKLDPKNGLTILALKNAVSLMNKHPNNDHQKIAWSVGRIILSRLRYVLLPEKEFNALIAVEKDFFACGRQKRFSTLFKSQDGWTVRQWVLLALKVIITIGSLYFFVQHFLYSNKEERTPAPMPSVPKPTAPSLPCCPSYCKKPSQPTPIEEYTMKVITDLGTFMCLPGDLKRCKHVSLSKDFTD